MYRALLVLWAFYFASVASLAQAGTLERLQDGRIVLTAFGERMYFREADAKHITVFWPSYPCTPRPPTGIASLFDWLDNPVIAECLNKSIPDTYDPTTRKSFVLRIHFGFADGGYYPGPGKRIDSPLVSALFPGALTARELPSPPLLGTAELRIGDPTTRLACLVPLRNIPNDLDYEARSADPNRPATLFTLPAGRRRGNASRSLCIWGGSESSARLRSADSIVSFTLSWHDLHYEGPRPSWSLYDTAARKIAESIFADRPLGDIQ